MLGATKTVIERRQPQTMDHATLTTSGWTLTVSDLRWETDRAAGWLVCGVKLVSADDALRVVGTMTLTAEDLVDLVQDLDRIVRKRVGTVGHSVAWESAEEDARLTIHRDGAGALSAELVLDLADAGVQAQVETGPGAVTPAAVTAFRSGLQPPASGSPRSRPAGTG